MEGFGCFPAPAGLFLGYGIAFTGACSDPVCFEYGDHGQDIEEEPTNWIGGVVGAATKTEHYPFGRQLVGDDPGMSTKDLETLFLSLA